MPPPPKRLRSACSSPPAPPQDLSRGLLVERSLFVLSRDSRLRRGCLWLVRSRAFEAFILAAILGNCATLAAFSAREGFDDTRLGAGLVLSEYVFLAIFALEMVLKIISLGFAFAPGCYLRDGWNVIDFTVVILGFVQLGSFGNYMSLRTVRVLRPLRTITRVQGMKARERAAPPLMPTARPPPRLPACPPPPQPFVLACKAHPPPLPPLFARTCGVLAAADNPPLLPSPGASMRLNRSSS